MTVETEAIHVPACGLDIHKDVIEACVIGEDGGIFQRTFDTMRKSLYALRDWILSFSCLNVLMESTSVYWIPIFEILEGISGMNVGVGNARHMKNVPGRPKTDKADAKWIARLCMMGLILKSFVVGHKFRELREYTRYYKKMTQERARQVNRIEKLLQMNGFKLSSVLSDITGKSGIQLLEKLCNQGFVTQDDVINLIIGRVKKTPTEIESAINGQMKMTSRWLLKKMMSKLKTCDNELSEIYEMMLDISKDYNPQIRLIEGIPGMGELSALYVIAEISTDMSSFRTANHIAAWAGVAPKDYESAGKLKFSKTKKANIYIKSILVECAWAAIKSRNTRLSNWYWSNVSRLGEKKAITAVARKLLIYIYAMLKSGELYDDSLDAADTQRRKAVKLDSAHKILEHRQSKNAISHNSVVTDDGDDAPRAIVKPDVGVGEVSNAPVIPKKRGRPRKILVDEKQSGSYIA
jgi:transposase